MIELTTAALQRLKDTGWQTRQFNRVSAMIRQLEISGYSVFPAAIEFFEKYGGLVLPVEDYHTGQRILDFDWAEVVEPFRVLSELGIPGKIGTICYLGEYRFQNENALWIEAILIDEVGNLYKYIDASSVDRLGTSPEEMFNNSVDGFNNIHRVYPHDDTWLKDILLKIKTFCILAQPHIKSAPEIGDYLTSNGYKVYYVELPNYETNEGQKLRQLINFNPPHQFHGYASLESLPEPIDASVIQGYFFDFDSLYQAAQKAQVDYVWVPKCREHLIRKVALQDYDHPKLICGDIRETHRRAAGL